MEYTVGLIAMVTLFDFYNRAARSLCLPIVMNSNVIVDLPSLSMHSQDVNIQTALDINSIHARNLELWLN